MNPFIMKAARPVAAMLFVAALAMTPLALAQSLTNTLPALKPPPTPTPAPASPKQINNPQQPGSVIVFPKFIQGMVTLPEGGVAPITELEVGVVCPQGSTCVAHQAVTIQFQWICGTTEAAESTGAVCQETQFTVAATVGEKIVLTVNGETLNSYGIGLPSKTVPGSNCPNGAGYLIGWVINNKGKPIKFDSLIGEALLRPGSPAGPTNMFAGSPTAATSYDAIPIQADANLATKSAVTLNTDGGLIFDGGSGHYQAVSGKIRGDVRYTNLTTGPTFTNGVLTLLTLDVKANRQNNPTFVDLDFYGGNPSAIGNGNVVSTSTAFVCWGETPITSIDPSLTTSLMGREGVVTSDTATKEPFNGIQDTTGPVSLLGLSETLEGGVFPPVAPWPRAAFSRLFNDSAPATSHFSP